ncbi:hypothetical protein BH20ACT2_BH20ACT2_00410 [soil metagenome]
MSGPDASDDAWIAVALGAVAVLLGVALAVRVSPLLVKVFLLATAAGAAAVAVIDIIDVDELRDSGDIDFEAGLFVLAGGAVVVALAALLIRLRRPVEGSSVSSGGR